MKKLSVVLLALLMLVGCGKKSDIDTLELINKAFSGTEQKETGAFELALDYDMSDSENEMSLKMEGLVRQERKIDVEAIRNQDFSGINIELIGTLDMASFGTKMDMSFYMNEGVMYADLLGSKIKVDLKDFKDEINDALENVEGEESKPLQFTEEDLKDFKITEEDGYVRYTLKEKAVKRVLDSAKSNINNETLDNVFENLELSIDVNNDGTLRAVEMTIVGNEDGMKQNISFTMTSMDLKDARKIEFPEFKGYQDIGAMGI